MELKHIEKMITEQSEDIQASEVASQSLLHVNMQRSGEPMSAVLSDDKSMGGMRDQGTGVESPYGFGRPTEPIAIPEEGSKEEDRSERPYAADHDGHGMRLQSQKSLLLVNNTESQLAALPPDDRLSTLSSIEETHEDFVDKTKKIKLKEEEIENVPVLREQRESARL